jgi:hypothetical protein
MKTGRFINKLHNNVLGYFQTEGCDTLLSDENFKALWNVDHSGIYEFNKDMAFAYVTLTPEFDSGGRMIMANDTVIVKFEPEDFEEQVKVYKQNNGALSNPLQEVKL